MGKLIAVVNDTDSPIYVGDQVVVPGNCRHFDEDLVPPHLRPAEASLPAETGPADPPADETDPVAKELGCASEQLLDRIAAIEDPGLIMKLAELEIGRGDAAREAIVDALGQRQLELGEKLREEAEREKDPAAPNAAQAPQQAADAAPAPAGDGAPAPGPSEPPAAAKPAPRRR